MQSNQSYERNKRPARPPVEFKVREERRNKDANPHAWKRNDQRRRQSDLMM